MRVGRAVLTDRRSGIVVLVTEQEQVRRPDLAEIDEAAERVELDPGLEIRQLAARHISQQVVDSVAGNAVVDEYVGVARQAASRDPVGAQLRGAVEEAVGL